MGVSRFWGVGENLNFTDMPIKRTVLKTMTKHEEIVPQEHYCTNCGSKEFTVEKLEKINFININYAVLVKKELVEEDSYATTTQCWQERTIEKPKLLTKFL